MTDSHVHKSEDAGRPTVLFIAGSGRSGSTIFHNLLGQLPGVTAVGEVRYIWERGFGKDQLCGCGRRFGACPLWSAVAEDLFGGMEKVPHRRLAKLTERFRIKDLPLAPLPLLGPASLARVGELVDVLSQLYRSIAGISRSDVIVDSSKNPSFGYLLRQMEEVDLKVLHFVRDGRAVAHSWSQRRESQPGEALRRQSIPASSLQWNARNATAELFLRGAYRRLRYEDFVARPRQELAAVAEWIGRDDADLPIAGDRARLSEPNHSVFGNEVRFATGDVTLSHDVRWKTDMAPRDRRIASALTFPLRLRYGYVGQGPDREVTA